MLLVFVYEMILNRAGTNTPSDEYDSYREYRVANTNVFANTLFPQRLLILLDSVPQYFTLSLCLLILSI